MTKKKKQKPEKDNHCSDKPQTSCVSPVTRQPLKKYIFEYLMLLFLCGFVFLIYSNNLKGPFVFDDLDNILNNHHIRLTELNLETIKNAAFKSFAANRPVANVSFALNYYFSHYKTTGYHVINILIHMINGILLYFFVKIIFSHSQAGAWEREEDFKNLSTQHSVLSTPILIPFIVSLVWLSHPLHTQSVSYIVQRMNSMAAMFYMLSFLCYINARLTKGKITKYTLFIGCIFSGIMALGSKEISATLPFFIFLYEWYFFQNLSREWLRRYIILPGIICLLFLAFTLMYMGVNPIEFILGSYKNRTFTLTQRVLTEFRVIIFYISLLIFPHPSRLTLEHEFPLSYSLMHPVTTILSIGVIAGLLILAIVTAKKERLISFCILWFFGNLAIESSVIGLEIIFEHRAYLPSMMVVLMAILLIHRYTGNTRLKAGLLCTFLIACGLWTYERNAVWSDAFALTKDCVEKSPNKPRVHNNFGVVLESRGMFDRAIHHYSEALRIQPNYILSRNNMGNALIKQGKTEEAIRVFSETIQMIPNNAMAYNNMGYAFLTQRKFEEAVEYYSKSLELDPNYEKACNNMGYALAELEKHNEAIQHYKKAIQINPDFFQAQNNLANALANQGKFGEAMLHYTEALRINPEYADAHTDLGGCLAKLGRIDEAIFHLNKALEITSENPRAYYNLGRIMAALRNPEKAIQDYTEALRLKPDFWEAHYNLANMLAGQGNFDDAIYHYDRALEIKPDFAEAHINIGMILAKQGYFEIAVCHLSEALELRPDFEEVRRNLEILQALPEL